MRQYYVMLEWYDGSMRRQATGYGPRRRRHYTSVARARAAAEGALRALRTRRYPSACIADATGRVVHDCAAEAERAYQRKRRDEYLSQERGW